MARVRRDRPDLTARGVIHDYVSQIAQRSFRDSCLFHGEAGCTLRPDMRARLCDSFFCSPLKAFLRARPSAAEVTVVAGPAGWDGGRPAPAPPGRSGAT
jgi:hypothetical protein